MTRTILSFSIMGLAVLMWVGPVGLAIFDMVTWMVGFGPVTGIDWYDEDRRSALTLWTLFGWLPMTPVAFLAAGIGDWR